MQVNVFTDKISKPAWLNVNTHTHMHVNINLWIINWSKMIPSKCEKCPKMVLAEIFFHILFINSILKNHNPATTTELLASTDRAQVSKCERQFMIDDNLTVQQFTIIFKSNFIF